MKPKLCYGQVSVLVVDLAGTGEATTIIVPMDWVDHTPMVGVDHTTTVGGGHTPMVGVYRFIDNGSKVSILNKIDVNISRP